MAESVPKVAMIKPSYITNNNINNRTNRNGYDVYLKKCLLPVAPSKITMKISNQNKTINLIDEGQINMLKKPGLTDIEFECMIPQVQYNFAVYKTKKFNKASYFLNYFEKLKTGRKPFQFIVTRALPSGKALFNTNIKVSMEEYQITESAGDGFDLTVKVKLKQYKAHGTKTVDVKLKSSKPKAAVKNTRETDNSPAPDSNQSYTVVSGDCLWNIAKKFYGNGSLYTVIYDANKDKISNPNLIYPGQVLTIPAA